MQKSLVKETAAVLDMAEKRTIHLISSAAHLHFRLFSLKETYDFKSHVRVNIKYILDGTIYS